jgi:ubiquinone/menaquinone biosynthesis C-methylase UbiE
MMAKTLAGHYGGDDLIEKIAESLCHARRDLRNLATTDLAPYDEFHFRGRKATLELGNQMKLTQNSRVLDIGSGLGGPARTLAEKYGCHVTGIDLTKAFCDVATVLSEWSNLTTQTTFRWGNATNIPFQDNHIDCAMTIHVAMNIPEKHTVYEEARRVVKPGGIFAVYDILQGEGGDISFPVPWANERSFSHLATCDEMRALLSGAGFKILGIVDTSEESHDSLKAAMMHPTQVDPPRISSPTQILFGDKFMDMARNQLRGLAERQIRTVSLICEV